MNTQYLLRGTFQRETTVFPGNFSDKKGSIHFNINSNSDNQKFSIQFTGNYMSDNNQLPAIDYTSMAIATAPNAPELYNPDATINWMQDEFGRSTWINPLSALQQKYVAKSTNLIGNVMLFYRILPELLVRTSLGYNSISSSDRQLNSINSIAPERRSSTPRTALYGDKNISTWIIEPQIEYNKEIDDGKLGLLIGSTIQKNISEGQIMFASGFTSDDLLENIMAATFVGPSSFFQITIFIMLSFPV